MVIQGQANGFLNTIENMLYEGKKVPSSDAERCFQELAMIYVLDLYFGRCRQRL